MSYPYPGPPPGGTTPPVIGWDVAVSVCLLVVSFLGCSMVTLAGLFLFAFADYCPPETCHPDRAVTWLGLGLALSAVALVIGSVAVTVSVTRRRISWPVAVIVTVVCVIGCGAGIVGEFTSLS
ncbi:hypothetical protein [Nocardia aurantia]|uniref:Transmembrane protein n=1 Tax=Nocardia aurantia TaxID=2585199 RepID=A0A7K0DVM9_9NOCA|nr:hypothetical protein [Nocardia aurantia]MQY29826.1 hypothetical protein [Nocardia aurantia]